MVKVFACWIGIVYSYGRFSGIDYLCCAYVDVDVDGFRVFVNR